MSVGRNRRGGGGRRAGAKGEKPGLCKWRVKLRKKQRDERCEETRKAKLRGKRRGQREAKS